MGEGGSIAVEVEFCVEGDRDIRLGVLYGVFEVVVVVKHPLEASRAE